MIQCNIAFCMFRVKAFRFLDIWRAPRLLLEVFLSTKLLCSSAIKQLQYIVNLYVCIIITIIDTVPLRIQQQPVLRSNLGPRCPRWLPATLPVMTANSSSWTMTFGTAEWPRPIGQSRRWCGSHQREMALKLPVSRRKKETR